VAKAICEASESNNASVASSKAACGILTLRTPTTRSSIASGQAARAALSAGSGA
jgi:hypothetical protein